MAENFGGTKIWRIAKFWQLVDFNLAKLWPHAIEHAYKGSNWWIVFWQMAIETPNSPDLLPSKISRYMVLYMYYSIYRTR